MLGNRQARSILQLLFLCGMCSSGVGLAQGQLTSVTDERLEEIIVTGSRIARRSAELPTPTTVIDAGLIERSGTPNLGDVIHNFPALIDGLGGNANHNQGTGGPFAAGLELLNLRGLGTERTLVLVDGRRHVPGDSGTSAVDLSMIPTALVDRVEIITGGASAIYGADAVTGVVNMIMKRDFEGLQVDLLGGISGENDGERYDINLTYGANFADGRGNFIVSAGYTDERGIPITARSYANKFPAFISNPANTGPDDGVPDKIFVTDLRFTTLNAEGILSLVNNATTNTILPIQEVAFFLPLFPDDPFGLASDPALGDGLLPGQPLYDSFTFDRATGQVRPFDTGAPCDFVACEMGDGFRIPETNTLSAPMERVVVSLTGRYEFEPLTMDVGVTYGRVESGGTDQAFLSHDATFGPYLRIERDNAFLPPAMATEMDARALTAAPLAVLGIGANANNIRETWRLIIGGEGDLTDSLGYDFYAQYGEVNTEHDYFDVLLSRYFQAIDSIIDTAGNPVCRDPSGGCVAYNPFNRGASPEARAFVDVGLKDEEKMSQLVLGFSIDGDGFDLPAGRMQYAAGLEYRYEESDYQPHELLQARDPVTGFGLGLVGLTLGPTPEQNTFALPTTGDYRVTEVFGEALLPLVSDKTLMQSFGVDLAARYADYDSSGANLTWKTGLNWTVTDWARFRATYSRAIRAPNIRELFGPTHPGFAFMTDPCDVNKLTEGQNPANRQTNCAALGLPPDFQSLAQAARRGTTIRGNPDLIEETAETLTFGTVFNIADRVSITVDYWDVEIEDAITTFQPTTVLANCVDGPVLNPAFCSLVSRDMAGQILNVNVQDINAALFDARGIDMEVQFAYDFDNGSTLDVSLFGSYLDRLTFFQSEAFPETENKTADTFGRPRLRGVASATYSVGDLQLGSDLRYIGSSRIKRDVQPEQLPFNKFETKVYHDVDVRFQIRDNIEIFGGINNVANEEPPLLRNYGTLLYDGIGRFFYAGVQLSY